MDALPDEVLLRIFAELRPRDLPAARAACRRWRRVASDATLWREVPVAARAGDCPPHVVRLTARASWGGGVGPHVESLSVADDLRADPADLWRDDWAERAAGSLTFRAGRLAACVSLRFLHCEAPLSGPLPALPALRHLALEAARADALGGLAGGRVESLHFFGGAPGLAPAARMPLLHSICLLQCDVASLEPLRQCAGLRHLCLEGLPAGDLGPLDGLPIEALNLEDCPVAAVPHLPRLVRLRVEGCPLASLAGLRDSAGLRFVWIFGSPAWEAGLRLRSLDALGGKALEQVHVTNAAITDLSPVCGPALRDLNVFGCAGLADLLPLARCPALEALSVGATRAADLLPLTACRLRSLEVSGSRVRDLAPVRGMPWLEHLAADHTPVDSVEPLRGHPALASVSIRECAVENPLAVLSTCPRLTTVQW